MSTRSDPTTVPSRIPAYSPYLLALFLFLVGIAVAPMITMIIDVRRCFLPWAMASRGAFPWLIYVTRTDCNYPPLWLYVLTFVENARLALHAEEQSKTAIWLLKLPSIVAVTATIIGCVWFLRKPFGTDAARYGSIAVACCLALWVDAAIWGQVDAPLCLLLMAIAWALIHEKPELGGVLAGLSLALKLQAIVALPFLLIYAWHRFGWQRTLISAALGILTLAAVSVPFLMHSKGSAQGLLLSYTGAVGMYDTRSTEAYNMWHLSIGYDRMIRHLPATIANADNIPYLGPFTPKQIGLATFALAILPVVYRLWNCPTVKTLFWSVAIAYISFFMLCTQMHERYILPGLVFLAMLYGVSPGARRFYPLWSITTLANHLMAFVYFNRVALNTVEQHQHGLEYVLFRGGSVTFSILQIGMFALLYRAFWSETKPLSDFAYETAGVENFTRI